MSYVYINIRKECLSGVLHSVCVVIGYEECVFLWNGQKPVVLRALI